MSRERPVMAAQSPKLPKVAATDRQAKLLKFIANALFHLPLKTLFVELNNGSDGSEYQFCPFKPSGWPPPPIPLPLGWWW